jgi:protein gp37
MGDKTKIEWADASWNPLRAIYRNPLDEDKIGWHCEKVSGGCDHCYSEAFNENRFGTGLPFKPGHRKDVEIFLDETILLQPLKWKRPRKIFVCSMTDLFGDFHTDEWIDKMFAVMALCPQHTFQILTKRSRRMREYMDNYDRVRECNVMLSCGKVDRFKDHNLSGCETGWPLPNVWLGVSCEDQTRADERIPDLLATPAAVRFVSAEPLLGPVDFEPYLSEHFRAEDGSNPTNDKIDWIIVNAEFGKKARPMHPDWARAIRDQCADAGTAFFFKQWGEWAPGENCEHTVTRTERTASLFGNEWQFESLTPLMLQEQHIDDEPDLYRIGKKRAGRHLDGVIHDAMPQVAK